MVTDLNYRPWERAFLGYETKDDAPAKAKGVVVPFPLEASVTYGTGTSAGPDAIINASAELELFDIELWSDAYSRFGIATLETPSVAAPLSAAIDQVACLVSSLLEAGKFPLILGGEHALTIGAVRPFADRYQDLAILQFDAHADLRDGYRGEAMSHAAAMRRVLDHDHVELVSVGVRSISAAEVEYLSTAQERIRIHWAKDIDDWDVDTIVEPLKGRPVYVTFDVDGFDSSLMPATGTPEPGGFFFDHAERILRAVSETATIVGADVVELAPISGQHAPDFTAAKIAYKIISYALTGANRIR